MCFFSCFFSHVQKMSSSIVFTVVIVIILAWLWWYMKKEYFCPCSGVGTDFNSSMNSSMPYDQWVQQQTLVQPYDEKNIGAVPSYSSMNTLPSNNNLVYMSTPNGGYYKDVNTGVSSTPCDQSVSYDSHLLVDTPNSIVQPRIGSYSTSYSNPVYGVV